MINLFEDKIYLIIFIIIIIIVFCFLGNFLIKKIVRDELRKIYKLKKRKRRISTKNINSLEPQNEILIQPNTYQNQNTYPVAYAEQESDIENQSYLDPLSRSSHNIEYQNFNNNVNKDNILMRDIMDNTPNNRFQ